MPTNDEIFSFMSYYGGIVYKFIFILFCLSHIYKDIKKRKLGNLSITIIFLILMSIVTTDIIMIYVGPSLEPVIDLLLISYVTYEIVYFIIFVIKSVKKKQSAEYMKKYYGSLLDDGIIISPGVEIELSDNIYIHGFTTAKEVVSYSDVQKIIYSSLYFRVKFCSAFVTFTMQSLFFINKSLIKNLMEHGVFCEKYDKKKHNPNNSTYRFWHHK